MHWECECGGEGSLSELENAKKKILICPFLFYPKQLYLNIYSAGNRSWIGSQLLQGHRKTRAWEVDLGTSELKASFVCKESDSAGLFTSTKR